MNKIMRMILMAFLMAFISCEPESPINPDNTDPDLNIGTVEFDFQLMPVHAPLSGIHRIDLSLARSAYDLYRGEFLISANVSDRERIYTFKLIPGDYYFQAGITCTCLGDTCLWDGFPGGRFGTKWTMGMITVVKGETLEKKISINQ